MVVQMDEEHAANHTTHSRHTLETVDSVGNIGPFAVYSKDESSSYHR